MKKKITAILLALALLLTACGKSGDETAAKPEREQDGGREKAASQTVTIAEPRIPQETVPGYKSTVIEPPHWAEELGSGAVMGDVFYILAETGEGAQAVAAYDTITEQWQRYDLDLSPVYFARVQKFSAAGGALWILLREGYGPEDTDYYQDKYYWLLHYDLETGEQSCNKLEFWQEGGPYLLALIALDGERALLGDGESSFLIDSRGQLLQCFMWAAAAEFIDRDAGTCSFDTGAFASWLELLKTVYERDTGEYRGKRLFSVWNDFASAAGHRVQSSHGGAYAPLGFPGAGGSGSYFMELARPGLNGGLGYYEAGLELRSSGLNTSLGIMASGEKRDGAWRFMSSFMAGENEPYIYDGIPVRKDSFEKAMENQLERSLENEQEQKLPYEPFGEQDAEYLRQLVYSTDKMVINDPALLELMKREINAFMGGKYGAQDCASQIQSRASLYLAEQS